MIKNEILKNKEDTNLFLNNSKPSQKSPDIYKITKNNFVNYSGDKFNNIITLKNNSEHEDSPVNSPNRNTSNNFLRNNNINSKKKLYLIQYVHR